MSRPKPTVLHDHTDPNTSKAVQVLEADAIYAVFHDGKPINMRSFCKLVNQAARYHRVSFSNPGHAFNLAERLNRRFKTSKYEVYKLAAGARMVEK